MCIRWLINLSDSVNIFDKCTQIMAYIVDVVIMGMRLQDVEKVYTSLIEQKLRWN